MLHSPKNLSIVDCVLYGRSWLILEDYLTLISLCKPYKLQNFLLYNFLFPLVLSSHFGLNFFLSNLLIFILSLCSSLFNETKIHVYTKCKILKL
jgi:hypothetical protein